MLRLQTLGNVFVVGNEGMPLGGAASQRRTLALLATLAIAGEGGLSRDKLVGILWPDANPERARHSLTQALYAARRALGADDLFLVNADIRLNGSLISSDVQQLEAALNLGDLEQAVALYKGPFLDGFFLSGSLEFEEWSSLQRTRIEARVSEALERLAEQAELQGSVRGVVDWRRRVMEIRPLDAGNVVKLMTALIEVGDRAGALQHAQVHELMLRQQLDLRPDAAVTALVSKLREPETAAVSAGEDSPVATERRAANAELAAVASGFAGAGVRSVAPGWLGKRRRNSWRLATAIALGLILLTLALGRDRSVPRAAAPAQLHQKLVVAPFRVQGASSSLGYLRDGIVELLSTRLADDTAARAVDAGAVLRAWEDAGITTSAAVPRDSIVKLAASLGAERIVTGSVVGTPSHLILRAYLISVPLGSVSREAVVQGPADSIATLIDGLAAKLLVAEAGEDDRLASYTTSSLAGLRTYLAGQAAFRQNRYSEAMRLYEVALGQDPTFALAALRLAVAANRINYGEQKRRGVTQAWASRSALSTWDHALLVALAGARFPLPASPAEELTVWRHLVELAPNDPESWYTLGANLFHNGAAAGVDEASASAGASLERALSIDDGYAPAELLLAHLATRPQSADDPESASFNLDQIADENPFAPFLAWRIALGRGDTVALRRIRGTLRDLGTSNLRLIAMASQFDAVGTADGALALNILQTRTGPASSRRDLVLAQHSLALQQGRPREALAATTRLSSLQPPGSQAHLRLRVLDGIYAEGDQDVTAGAARQLERFATGGMAAGAVTSDVLSNLCVVAQWRVSKGDTAGVSSAVQALRRAGPSFGQLPAVSTSPVICAELLDVWLVTLTKRGEALPRLQRFDSLVLTPEVAGDAAAYAPILLARLNGSIRQPARALQAVRKRVYMSGWPRYLATALREEGRLAELSGDRAGARDVYRRYLALRPSPENEVLSQVKAVQHLLAALGPENAPRAQ